MCFKDMIIDLVYNFLWNCSFVVYCCYLSKYYIVWYVYDMSDFFTLIEFCVWISDYYVRNHVFKAPSFINVEHV